MELAALDSIDHGAYTEYIRAKRSGSPDFFSAIKHKISAGIHSKLKQIGQASAGFSTGGSAHKEHGYNYDPVGSQNPFYKLIKNNFLHRQWIYA